MKVETSKLITFEENLNLYSQYKKEVQRRLNMHTKSDCLTISPFVRFISNMQ